MYEYYGSLKLAHVCLAMTSIAFFLVRALWSIRGSGLPGMTWARISPHVIDTFLLLTAIILAVASHQYPLQQSWLTAKVIALCLYILFGTMAIKRAPTALSKCVFAILALLTFLYIVAVAITKDPFPHALLY